MNGTVTLGATTMTRPMDTVELAMRLHVTTTTISRKLSKRELPRPLPKTGRKIFWDAQEIEDWINAEMPKQSIWEALKAARTKNP